MADHGHTQRRPTRAVAAAATAAAAAVVHDTIYHHADMHSNTPRFEVGADARKCAQERAPAGISPRPGPVLGPPADPGLQQSSWRKFEAILSDDTIVEFEMIPSIC